MDNEYNSDLWLRLKKEYGFDLPHDVHYEITKIERCNIYAHYSIANNDDDDNVVDADGFRFHLSIRKNGIFTHSEKFTDANVSMFRGMLVPILYYVYTCLSDENHPGCDDCIEFINTYPKIKFLYASI